MKTINSLFAAVIVLTTLFTVGCTKEESFISNTESSELENLPTDPEATLEWLEEHDVYLEGNAEMFHERFHPHAQATATKEVYIDLTGDGETTAVEAEIIDGYVVLEGDLVLGKVEDFNAQGEIETRGSVYSSSSRRWPNNTIYYELDPGLYTNPTLLIKTINAMVAINASTNLNMVERTNQQDYVKVQASTDGNYSTGLGKIGGKQDIFVQTNAPIGTIIHEFLHVAGLWHEQSRCDRDQYMYVEWQNIENDENSKWQFGKHCSSLTSDQQGQYDSTDGWDVYRYNISSVMHYPGTAFSGNGQATLVPNIGNLFPLYGYNIFALLIDVGKMGQRDGMNEIDIATVNAIYPK